ncbi:MAG: hypothetical protein OXU98_01620 [Gammaproteobacteria bacterium]|nr:hypothetical protein [Gammaproteobacteria bacterium]
MLKYDTKSLRIAARQIGVACVIGGLARGFFFPEDFLNASVLTVVGVLVIFISICRRKTS